MDIDKLREVVAALKLHLEGKGCTPVEFTNMEYQTLTTGIPLLQHCLWMLNKMEINLHPDNVTAAFMNKGLVWLGFVQGSLAALREKTIMSLRDMNRPEA